MIRLHYFQPAFSHIHSEISNSEQTRTPFQNETEIKVEKRIQIHAQTTEPCLSSPTILKFINREFMAWFGLHLFC